MNFRTDLENKLEECPKHYENFEKTFVNVLDAHAPRKTKVLRGNHKPHVDKNLRKAIMKRSKLKNTANRTKLQEDIAKYKKQRNLVVKLNRDSKLRYFDNIETSKNENLFGMSVSPTLPTNMLIVTLRSFLLKKKRLLTIQMKLSKRKSYE